MNHSYHFLTHWHIPNARIDEVFGVIAEVEALPTWWPSVYLSVRPIGGAYELKTKGWLPYTLQWQLTVEEVEAPRYSRIGAHGDFEGEGIWRLEQRGDDVHLSFDWRLLAEKPLLKILSPLLKPAFAANHQWAMQLGELSLRGEVQRRRGLVTQPPPGPSTWQPWAIAIGCFATVALVVSLSRKK